MHTASETCRDYAKSLMVLHFITYTPYYYLAQEKMVQNMCENCTTEVSSIMRRRDYKYNKSKKTCKRCRKNALKYSFREICDSCGASTKTCVRCCNSVNPEKTSSTEVLQAEEKKFNKIYQTLPEDKQRMFVRYVNQSSNNVSYSGNVIPLTKEDIYRKLKSLKISDKRKSDRGYDGKSRVNYLRDMEYNMLHASNEEAE